MATPSVVVDRDLEFETGPRRSAIVMRSNVEVERRAAQRTYRALYPSRVRSNRLLGRIGAVPGAERYLPLHGPRCRQAFKEVQQGKLKGIGSFFRQISIGTGVGI